MSIVLIAGFFVSLIGYFLGYKLVFRRSAAFFPIVYIAFTVVFLYVFGLAGILNIGLYIDIIAGVILVPLSIIKGKDKLSGIVKETVADPSWIFITAGTVWIYFITKGTGISHPDDFSHWYKICKIMHCESAYPTTPDLGYTTYPPGTATWIWFITSLIGFAPDKCFFAHSLINLAALNSFMVIGKDHKGILSKITVSVFTVVMSIALCSMDVSTYCLLTDTTLALVPLAALFWIMKISEDEKRKDIAVLVLLLIFEMLIKFPGILFAGFVYYSWLKSRKRVRWTDNRLKAASYLIPAVIPLAFFYGYVIRADLVFGELELSGQGFSLTRFIAMFINKSGEQVNAIIGRFFYEVFALFGNVSKQMRAIWIGLAFGGAGTMYLWKIKDENYPKVRKTVVRTAVFVALYLIFLLVTYLFSMNENEANASHLNCFYRYTGSVAIFVWGLLTYVFCDAFSRRKDKTGKTAAMCIPAFNLLICFIMFGYGFVFGFEYYEQVEDFNTAGWDLCCEYGEERTAYNEDSFFLVYDESDIADYFPPKVRLIGTVYFRSNNIHTFTLYELANGKVPEDELEAIRNCDYLVTMGDLSDYEDLIREYVEFGDYRPGTIDLKGE